MTSSAYPHYSRAERIADGAIHIAGLGAALLGVGTLYALWVPLMDSTSLFAVSVYSLSLLMMLGASAAYHMLAHTDLRPVLRRIDHAAIYIKIAGTMTPLGTLLNTGFAYAVLGGVWCGALSGAGRKLLAARGRMKTGWAAYLGLGWAGLLLCIPLAGEVSPLSLGLMFAGGLLYSAGIVFYRWESLRYANAIWHGFVLLASAGFFAGITTALARTAA